jgi:hypothetical protein
MTPWGRRAALEQQTAELRSRGSSPHAFRPQPPQPFRDIRVDCTFQQLLGEYLEAVRGNYPQVRSDEEAMFLATQALALIDSPRAAAHALSENKVQFLWHGYISSGLRRPDLVRPYGAITPAAAILVMVVCFWRRELAAVWAAAPDPDALDT